MSRLTINMDQVDVQALERRVRECNGGLPWEYTGNQVDRTDYGSIFTFRLCLNDKLYFEAQSSSPGVTDLYAFKLEGSKDQLQSLLLDLHDAYSAPQAEATEAEAEGLKCKMCEALLTSGEVSAGTRLCVLCDGV